MCLCFPRKYTRPSSAPLRDPGPLKPPATDVWLRTLSACQTPNSPHCLPPFFPLRLGFVYTYMTLRTNKHYSKFYRTSRVCQWRSGVAQRTFGRSPRVVRVGMPQAISRSPEVVQDPCATAQESVMGGLEVSGSLNRYSRTDRGVEWEILNRLHFCG